MAAFDAKKDSARLYGKRVEFFINDVHLPDPTEILAELHGQDVLSGHVTDLTECRAEGEVFAVIDVEAMTRPLVVPTRCLKL